MKSVSYYFIEQRDRYLGVLARRLPSWITPNGLTVFRFLPLAPMFLAYKSDMPLLVVLLFLLAFFLDLVDGTLARLRQVTSNFGGALDSLADKILFLITFWWLGGAYLPLWLIQGLLIVELWMIGVVLVWKPIFDRLRVKFHVQANIYGKTKTLLQILGVVCLAVPAPLSLTVAMVLFSMAVAAGTMSVIKYVLQVRAV